MTAPFPPGPPNSAWPRAATRPDDTRAIRILTVLVVLGVLILLGLVLTGVIWTPWQTFPAQTSAAGVLAEHGFTLLVGLVFAAPVAVG
jgi:hypothetical protein